MQIPRFLWVVIAVLLIGFHPAEAQTNDIPEIIEQLDAAISSDDGNPWTEPEFPVGEQFVLTTADGDTATIFVGQSGRIVYDAQLATGERWLRVDPFGYYLLTDATLISDWQIWQDSGMRLPDPGLIGGLSVVYNYSPETYPSDLYPVPEVWSQD